MAIEIVDFPIKHGDFPLQKVSSPEDNTTAWWEVSTVIARHEKIAKYLANQTWHGVKCTRKTIYPLVN